jgi:hypothetical protein
MAVQVTPQRLCAFGLASRLRRIGVEFDHDPAGAGAVGEFPAGDDARKGEAGDDCHPYPKRNTLRFRASHDAGAVAANAAEPCSAKVFGGRRS